MPVAGGGWVVGRENRDLVLMEIEFQFRELKNSGGR